MPDAHSERHRPARQALDRTAGRGTEKLSRPNRQSRSIPASYQACPLLSSWATRQPRLPDPPHALFSPRPGARTRTCICLSANGVLSRNWRAQPLLQCRCRWHSFTIDQAHFPPRSKRGHVLDLFRGKRNTACAGRLVAFYANLMLTCQTRRRKLQPLTISSFSSPGQQKKSISKIAAKKLVSWARDSPTVLDHKIPFCSNKGAACAKAVPLLRCHLAYQTRCWPTWVTLGLARPGIRSPYILDTLLDVPAGRPGADSHINYNKS